MKRTDIIQKLLREGFSSKTLMNFSDKQLQSLSSRMLSEDDGGTTVYTPDDLSKPDNIAKIKTGASMSGDKGLNVKVVPKGQPITVNEKAMPGLKDRKEVKEGGVPGLTAKKSSGELKNGTSQKEMKEGGVPGLKAKVVQETGVPGLTAKKSSGELKNGTSQKEMKESGVPGLTAKKSSGELKNGTSQKEMKEGGVPGLKAKVVQETGVPGLTAKKSSGELKNGTSQKEMKESGVPGLTAKKSSGELKNGTSQKEMKEGAMPGLTVKGGTNIAKPVSKPGKEEGEEDITEKKKSFNFTKKKGDDKSEDKKDEKGGKVDKHKAFVEMLKKKKENKSINEWVEDAVQKHYHPFTTKNDIMEMISSRIGGSVDIEEEKVDMVQDRKLPDFMKAKSIRGGAAPAPAQPKTKPGTQPTTKPNPGERPRKTPYQPGPGVNPHPKAKSLAENEPAIKPKVPVVNPGSK